MGVSINSIQQQVWEMASKINAPKSLTTVFAASPQDGRPHVEIHKDEFHLITEERGAFFSENVTENLDILLYWIFRSITLQMAQEYELQHRVEHQDSRKIMFLKQLELMFKLSPTWHNQLKDEIEAILFANPYVDPLAPT